MAVRAVVFDVFGTVVDWRGSLMPLGEVLPVPDRPVWPDVVDTWRRMYQPALDQARKQERWQDLDAVNRRTLPAAFRAHGRPEPENAFVTAAVDRWHRLEPWPDSRAGLLQLSEQYVTATLSNGHTALLEELVAYGDLSFTRVLSAQDARSYKPDPVVYLTAADTLGCRPEEVVLVAAHRHDLAAAAKLGFATAFLHRPHEWGPDNTTEPGAVDPAADVSVQALTDLVGAFRVRFG